jgi:ribosome-associated heat shock protein Hsp15
MGIAQRRGPASEAATLYKDLLPPSKNGQAPAGIKTSGIERERGSGRPTKRQRRALERFRGS